MPYNILGDLQTLTLSPSAQCDNPCCILTLDNSVQLMGNILLTDYESGTGFATLPESMRPMDTIFVPVYLDAAIDATTLVLLYVTLGLETQLPALNLVPMEVTPDGEMCLNMDIPSGTLYLNGVEFGAYDRYYNDTIGNNYSQGTAPLRWDGSEQ